MIHGLSKHGVALLATLGILAGEALFISQPALAQTKQCSAQQIKNNIENLLTDPALVDTLAACGSDALPTLLRYLDRSESFGTRDEEEIDYQRLLIVTAIGRMGSRASSSARDLAKLMSSRGSLYGLNAIPAMPSFNALLSTKKLQVQYFDKAIVYSLWQINGAPTRTLAQIGVDTKESLLLRQTAILNLQYFARDYANLIPGGINSIALKQTTNKALLMIALNPKDDLNFRLSAFENLKREGVTVGTLAKMEDAITKTLLDVIQNQAEKAEERIIAVDKINYLYSEILRTSVQPVYAQVIISVLTKITLESRNTTDIRNDALSL